MFKYIVGVVMNEEKIAATEKNIETSKLKLPSVDKKTTQKKEAGGPQGPEPTRYGDWEFKGRCVDF